MSAAVRLMPSPPALVLSRKTKMSVLEESRGGEGREDGEGGRGCNKIIYSCTLKVSRCSFRAK